MATASLGQAASGKSPLGGHPHKPQHRAIQHTAHKLQGKKKCELGYCTVKKVLGPKEISQPVDPAKDMRNPREFDFGVQWNLITELPQDWETECWGWGTAKTLCTSVARSGEQGFQKRLGQAWL